MTPPKLNFVKYEKMVRGPPPANLWEKNTTKIFIHLGFFIKNNLLLSEILWAFHCHEF
jgi:hypothetical protein